jgi:hypothetical protein
MLLRCPGGEPAFARALRPAPNGFNTFEEGR